MSVTVRGMVWATDTSAAQTFARCAQEAGDTVVFIAAGGNKITSLDPSMPTVDYQTGQEAQGFVGVEESDGLAGAAFTAYFDGADPHALLMVALAPGERGIVYAADTERVGSVGASYPEETVTLDLSAKRGNRQIIVAFARNTTTLPACEFGEPDYSAVIGGSAMSAWIRDPGTRTATTLVLPAGRSGHYVAAVNVKPTPLTVKTYLDSDGDYEIVKVMDGAGGGNWNTFRSRRVLVTTTTDTYREHPTADEIIALEVDARDGVPNLTSSGPSLSGAFTVSTNYSAGGGLFPAPPYATTNDVRHHFHPLAVSRYGVPDADAGGDVNWSPNYLEPSEWPDDALTWEWPDGTDYYTGDTVRPTELTSVIFDGESQGEPLDTSAHPHTNPSIISAFYAQTAGVTWREDEDGNRWVDAWTPATEHGLAEFAADAAPVTVELIDYLDGDGQCVLFSKAAAKITGLTVEPLAPDSPGYISPGSSDGDLAYGYFIQTGGGGDFTLTWRYRSPAFRWVTSVTEVDIEDSTPPLRHLTRRDGLESTAGRVTGGRSQQGSARRVSGHW